MDMSAIVKLAFLLSGVTNGADFYMGVGFADNPVMLDPVGIVRIETPIIEHDDWGILLKAAHHSSIPDARYETQLYDFDIVSIELKVSIRK